MRSPHRPVEIVAVEDQRPEMRLRVHTRQDGRVRVDRSAENFDERLVAIQSSEQTSIDRVVGGLDVLSPETEDRVRCFVQQPRRVVQGSEWWPTPPCEEWATSP